ncbi:MAG: hypothetical protein ACRD82_21320, partial [Blastocatellia bacterium]
VMQSKPSDKKLAKRKAARSYSDLTIGDLKQMFGLKAGTGSLFPRVSPIAPSSWLTETLEKGRQNAMVSEKARAEFIVTPVLLLAQGLSRKQVSLYSGIRLDVDADKGLKGVCDFVFSQSPPLPFLEAPILVLVEAKKNDVEEGIGQCAAEMVAAQIFNRESGNSIPVIYGCVTTGETWQFLKLTGVNLVIDEDRYFIDSVTKILGILKYVLSSANSKTKRGKKL